MSTVDSAASATTTGLTQAASGAKSSSDAASKTGLSDYDSFLSLLTAQLKNQDPLNPQDSTAFVEQIATFTGVEQQLNTNAKLDQLIAAQTNNALTDLAQWVGREVSATGMVIDFKGADVTLSAPSSGGAQEAAVVIKDLNGSEIARLSVDPKGGQVVWDGQKSEGGKAEAGQYQIEYAFTTNTANGAQVRTETATSNGKVIEARLAEGGGTELVLEGGLVVVKPSAVTSVLAAGASAQSGLLSQAADAAQNAADAAETIADAAEDISSDA